MFSGPPRHLDGPPFALPRPLDVLAEGWWRARPRSRALLGVAGAAVVVLAGIGHAASSPHGPPTGVWVASRDLTVGHVLSDGDARRATWPRDLIPDGAVDRLEGIVHAPLPRGAVVTDRHVGTGGIAAGLPDGSAAVAVPHEALPPLQAGTRIDLVAADVDGSAVTLAAGAVVLATDEVAVWVAVDHAAAAQVAGAAGSGALGVVVLPP